MSQVRTANITTADALWTLIQSQTKSVKEALYQRIKDEEESKTFQQQSYVRDSLGRTFKELKEHQANCMELPEARSLLKALDEQ